MIIGIISCFDAGCNLFYPVNSLVEENPLAKYLLIISEQNVALLISMKATGTILALSFLKVYYYYFREQALIIASTLAIVQFFIIVYMLTAVAA